MKGNSGDVYIESWDTGNGDAAHFKVTICNIFAKSYMQKAAKDGLAIATMKEEQKKNKCKNKLTYCH